MLPEAMQSRREWRVATEALPLVVEYSGDPMLAHIGIMRALNAGESSEPPSRRKRAKKHRIIR